MLTSQELQKVILENAKLKSSKIANCKGCKRMKLHPCGAFYWCPLLGQVDPNIDGCSKRL